jgi:hypothetical protein
MKYLLDEDILLAGTCLHYIDAIQQHIIHNNKWFICMYACVCICVYVYKCIFV